MNDLDRQFYLMGDEDGGVGLHCRDCDRGGLPIAYYSTNPNDIAYKTDDVVRVSIIGGLVNAGGKHAARHLVEKRRHLV